ncbi:hypothetical protein [Variovorax sp. dw_308]|uniref:hypothetical protein n=1 Tax=Variovorax sp. dw_308 TaxID=2721546 RepID=UPI001C45285D|nr:hypothetical protein [Variovorax sp. dw_308]
MSVGVNFVAPEGYVTLKKGVKYLLLRNDGLRKRVLFVSFHDRTEHEARHAALAVLSRNDFEAGLVPGPRSSVPPLVTTTRGAAEGDDQKEIELPPWLESLKGTSFGSDPRFTEAKQLVDERLLVIGAALNQINAILQADDPDRELNKLARACKPAVNETRFRLWFYLYVAYGYQKWAVLPARSRWGKWDRLDPKYKDSHLGRPGEHYGNQFGHWSSQEMIQTMVDGFRAYVHKANDITGAWAMTLRLKFGCKVKKVNGEYEVFHPDGQPYPSYDQFRYRIYQKVGREEVRRILHGDNRYRHEDAAIVGSYHEGLSNLGDVAYFDSAQIVEYPKSYLGNYALPPLQQVDLVDGRSSWILGVGFSLGAEKAKAYNISMFCSALKKSEFGRIIGYPISDEDWPGHGVPAVVHGDRGKGATNDVKVALAPTRTGRDKSPTYTPQSDAPVETKHARHTKKQEAPTYVISDLTVIQLIKRQVRNAIKKNRSDDVSARASDRAVVEGGVQTPLQLRNYLADHHQDSLVEISFNDAVRRFLDPVVFEVREGKLYYKHRHYSSEEVIRGGLGAEMRHVNGMKLDGYTMTAVPKFAWIEYRGKLLEVEAVSHGDPYAALASLPELDQIANTRSRASGARQARKKLEVVAAQEEFKQETEREWHSGRTVKRRPKVKSKAAQDELGRIA